MRIRSKSARVLPATIVLSFAVVLCGAAPALAGDGECDHRPIDVTFDADNNRLIVVDGFARRVSLYEVGRALMKTGSATLDGPPGQPAHTTIELPDDDVPGDDPPGWVRPADWVRVQTAYRSGDTERWSALYLAPGGPIEAFESAYRGFEGWIVTSREVGVDAQSAARGARLSAERGSMDAEVQVDRRHRAPEGWSTVRVEVERPG